MLEDICAVPRTVLTYVITVRITVSAEQLPN
jgi:hypothetical protein